MEPAAAATRHGQEGRYMYCIIKSSQSQSFGPLGIGERSDELYTVCFKDIAAVVSNSPIMNYSLSRQNLLSHETAIEQIMKKYAVLPIRFGTIAKDEQKVKKILEEECDSFKDLLKNLKDKKELGLKAIFKEDIYKDILEKYEDIKILKEKLKNSSAEKTYYQRMEIGKMVEAALQKEREAYKYAISSLLSPLAEDVKLNNNYGEMMIINAAFLIDKKRETEFDQKIKELDEKYSDKIKFKYIGTVPPFNFVNLVIETGKY